MANQYVIKSARRTLEVLLAFTRAPHRFGLADLQQVTTFEKNQLYRSLRTLEAAGFIAVADDGRYEVTELARSLDGARPLN